MRTLSLSKLCILRASESESGSIEMRAGSPVALSERYTETQKLRAEVESPFAQVPRRGLRI